MCGGSVAGKTVGSWGLTFKAGTDDLRDSPAIKILRVLADAGAVLQAHDPTAHGPYDELPWLPVVSTARDAAREADVLVLLTEWPEYRAINPKQIAAVMSRHHVVDARNHLDRELWLGHGFSYVGVGR
jgi:UDPglucose 6-dehydrogenase